jgi:hypothetical protein
MARRGTRSSIGTTIRTRTLRMAGLGLGLGLLAAGGAGRSALAQSAPPCGNEGTFANLEIAGLTRDQRLLCFRERNLEEARVIGIVTGLAPGDLLIGIDFRPRGGRLYAVGSLGGIYTIDLRDASAALETTLRIGDSDVPSPLVGASFGVDFDPVADRLRIISDAGQNLVVDVETGAASNEAPLQPPPGADPAETPRIGLTALAYTNNDTSADTATVPFDIDTDADELAIQAPASTGVLNTIGKLRVNAAPDAAFDIASRVEGGRAVEQRGMAALRVGNRSALFDVNLSSGRAVQIGRFAARDEVIGLAIPLQQRGDPDEDVTEAD